MTTRCVISVAIPGSLPRKKDNPAVPIGTAEQIESTHAGIGRDQLTLVRNAEGLPG